MDRITQLMTAKLLNIIRNTIAIKESEVTNVTLIAI